MSEKHPINQEKGSSQETTNNHEAKKHHERINSKHEKEASVSKNEHSKNIEKIRKAVNSESIDKQEHNRSNSESEKSESNQPTLVNKELKNIAYKRTLKKTQAKLSPTSRSFSKIIHQPTIEKVSETAGKTIARPSGILFGGIFSFIGSSVFLWSARHYGYEYNFLLFLLFFVGGFFVGLLVEIILSILRSK